MSCYRCYHRLTPFAYLPKEDKRSALALPYSIIKVQSIQLYHPTKGTIVH